MDTDLHSLARELARLEADGPVRRYLVAFSGGADSHVLLHLMHRYRDSHAGVTLAAVHVHHGMHPEADAWAAHCERICAALDVPLTVCRVQVEPAAGGPEAAARRARYAAFAGLLQPGDVLLLAHHQRDQAETLLLQLLRGAGPDGLAAMPISREWGPGRLARPLRDWSHYRLRDYARAHGLAWVEDPGNASPAYDRNFLRHAVLPRLRGRWPATDALLARSAAHLAEAGALLRERAEEDWQAARGPQDTLLLPVLATLSPARQRNLLRYWVGGVHGLPLPDHRHLARIQHDVLGAAPDAMPLVHWRAHGGGVEVRRYRQRLYAGPRLAPHDPRRVYPWPREDELLLPDLGARLWREPGTGIAAAALREAPVSIRFRAGGERCRPAGRGHRHTLKKLYQEWGVPPWLRDRVPLVYVGEELAQVVGYCTCAPFAAGAGEAAWQWQLAPAGGRSGADCD